MNSIRNQARTAGFLSGLALYRLLRDVDRRQDMAMVVLLILGVLLILNGLAYVAASSTAILLPAWRGMVSRLVLLPEAAGELSIIAWLLIRGLRRDPAASESPLRHATIDS